MITQLCASWIESLLNNPGVIVTLVCFAAAVLCKTAIKIFQIGVNYKAKLVTKEEQTDFEDKIRRDMRSYKNEIQDTLTEYTKQLVEQKLEQFDNLQDDLDEMRHLKAEVTVKTDDMKEKYDEMRAVSDTVRVLNNKVSKLEYGQEASSERRKEN